MLSRSSFSSFPCPAAEGLGPVHGSQCGISAGNPLAFIVELLARLRAHFRVPLSNRAMSHQVHQKGRGGRGRKLRCER